MDCSRPIRVAFLIDGGFENRLYSHYKHVDRTWAASPCVDGLTDLALDELSRILNVLRDRLIVVNKAYFIGSCRPSLRRKLLDLGIVVKEGKLVSGHEKGVDAELQREIYEMVFYRQVDVIVILASDGDHVPALRFARNQGVRILHIGANIPSRYIDGRPLSITTSKELLKHCDWHLDFGRAADRLAKSEDVLARKLFPSSGRWTRYAS